MSAGVRERTEDFGFGQMARGGFGQRWRPGISISPPTRVFHSDRGSNYTSAEFAGVLAGLGIRQSVGRTGICFDNALAESFNAAVKVSGCTGPRTRRKESTGGHCPVHRDPL